MMAYLNTSTSLVRSDSSEQREHIADSSTNSIEAPVNQPSRSSYDGPVAILWDIENCPVPSDVRPEDVGGNIRMALRVHPIIKGAVMMFSAYGDFNAFPRRLREGCQRTGVKLIDVPNGRKDAADKAILVDMFLFALDNPPPSSIMLISGDVDFAPALHILGQRGYTVILVIPSRVGVSSALCNAGKFVWDWPSVAHGEGFVPPARALLMSRDIPGYFMGCHINENFQNDEEAIVYRGVSQSYYNSRDFSLVSHSLSEYSSSSMMPCHTTTGRAHSLPSGMNGPVAILWDIENCPVPSDVHPEDVGGNIRMALRVHPIIKGAVMMFSAYGDFNAFPRRLREGCQRTGVKLIDVPNGRKDAADKAILVDMFLFALDNPPPSSIMLISGDVDFAPALHILGQRGYTVILVIPSGVGVSSALCNAGKFVWDWPSVAHGEGFVPPARALLTSRDIAGYFMGCHINENFQNDEEAIVYGGVSQSYYNSRDFSLVSHLLSEYSSSSMMPCHTTIGRAHSLPSGMNEVLAGLLMSTDHGDSTLWVQPGDLNGLKGQLVKLLELAGGCLPLTRVPAEYQKTFGRPLYISEYGSSKLVNLFEKMGDVIAVDGRGKKKFVYLRNWKTNPSAPPLILLRRDTKKGRGTQEESVDAVMGNASSDEVSDEERVVIEELDDRRCRGKTNSATIGQCDTDDQILNQFKYELQEILVSYSCQIFLGCFEAIYEQRYKKPLDYRRFCVDRLEDLFEKVRDVVVLHEEPVSKKKFLSAVGG